MTSRARLFKELKEVQRDSHKETEIVLYPDESNIFKWTAFIKGPADTPYEGGTFQLDIIVPEAYPLVPPAIRYVTKIFHPNVHYKVRHHPARLSSPRRRPSCLAPRGVGR
mmetsp:Transcript_58038/g.184432  ORF Transcript_58038/g.184432 Transcript_58038/m.184432 type:complete len:110 (-) Transcript_58038:407-736(-)